MTLLSGERQVAPILAGIRGDHRARYEFAARHLTLASAATVLDAGCGVGYGARVLADAGLAVHAWDHDDEAVAYGREHFAHPNIRWSVADVGAAWCHQADSVVAFEVLEHLDRPGLALIRFPHRLIASVPNEEVIPKCEGSYRHHVRHYTPADLERLLSGAGYRVEQWWTQRDTSGAPLARGRDGRTLVVLAVR